MAETAIVTKKTIDFIPCTRRVLPPTKLIDHVDGEPLYSWYITEDEYKRLSNLFGRDFQETRLGATKVHGIPTPCKGCGKYTEFIDWVWTALRRGVHSAEFIFNALKNGRQGDEVQHDVYCSECGNLVANSRDNNEGGAPNIFLATPIKRSDYPVNFKKADETAKANQSKPVWGKWWLDDSGSAKAWLAEKRKRELEEARAQAEAKEQN